MPWIALRLPLIWMFPGSTTTHSMESRSDTACTLMGPGASPLNGRKAMLYGWIWSNTTREVDDV
jgi:hypothetical protein